MKNDTTAAAVSKNGSPCKVYGTVRNAWLQPMPGVTVKVFAETIRGRQPLGEAVTAKDGTYTISYTPGDTDTAALIAGVYNADSTLLKEGRKYYDFPAELQEDFDLGNKPFAGIAEYDRLTGTIAPFAKDVPLAKMTQTANSPDISFIANKTGLLQPVIENLVMAARFETLSTLPASLWYGILTQSSVFLATSNTIGRAGADFETKLSNTFDTLMNIPANNLVAALQKAIDNNFIDYSITANLANIKAKIKAQLLDYAKKHPVTGQPSALVKKAQMAGLSEDHVPAFVEAHSSRAGATSSFLQQAKQTPALQDAKTADKLEAVFQLSALTGDNLALTQYLVTEHKIESVADIKKLAGSNQQAWTTTLTNSKIAVGDSVAGNTPGEKTQNFAAQLNASFAAAYPTATFAARMQKDTTGNLPHADKVTKFLQQNDGFDLLNHHVGTFLKNNEKAVPKEDAADVANQVRRIQRVFRLTADYDAASTLLNDGIHSAQQVHKMGKDNFVKTYGDKLGQTGAAQVFEKAGTVHATAMALTGNLRSMAEASSLNAFPDFGLGIKQLADDLPDLDTLFGHTDFCDCDECNSVYGAPAYLTDVLHYLDKRGTLLSSVGGKIPSVKDILLRRRPDIGDIDLECDNTNTTIPYIDIACEIMEDYVAPPTTSLTNTFLAKLVKGPINSTLLSGIKTKLTASGQTNISSLLTANATVSPQFTVNHLQADNTFLAQNHWIIRDSQVVLRASATAGLATSAVDIKLLHQTLLPSTTISAGPEYINTNAYNNFLKTAKRPFSLPFDLFETEGELYLEKSGVRKADLIDIFRKADKLAPGTSPADFAMAYASLGVNEAEQALIFVTDPTHQSLYWGTVTGTVMTVNVFEKLSGLNYSQIINLLQLQFINPLKDSVIDHDDLSTDTTTQRITNLTTTKLDAIHRFLRLWRKTSLTMAELDAIITGIGQGKIDAKFAWTLQHFLWLQQALQINAFQLLAFYQNLEANLHNQLFQNPEVTNPVNPVFAISAIQAQSISMGSAEKAVIGAALQISQDESNILYTIFAPVLSFNLLGILFRYVQFSRSVNISIQDLLTLASLIDANPFQDPWSTRLFIQKLKLVQSAGFSVDDLNYMLRHQDNITQPVIAPGSQVLTALSGMQSELLAVRAATQPAADANGSLLGKWLADPVFKWDGALLAKLIGILGTTDDTDYQQKIDSNSDFLINLRAQYNNASITTDLSALPTVSGAPIVLPASVAAQVTFDAVNKQLILIGHISPTNLAALKALSSNTAWTAALNTLNSAQQTDNSTANVFFTSVTDLNTKLRGILAANIADRFAFFINKISPVYRKLLQQNVLVKNISTWFNVDKNVVGQLLVSVPGIYTDFTNDNFVNKAASLTDPAGPYPLQSSRYQFVGKLCFIAGKLKLTDTDLAFLLVHAADVGSLNLVNLPLSAITTAATTFPGFEVLVNLLRFQQYYPSKVVNSATTSTTVSIYTVLLDAISQGTLTATQLATYTANLIANLTILTGWDADNLNTLIGTTNALTLTLPADIKTAPVLMQLHKCFGVLNQLGVTAADAVSWGKASLTFADSSKIKQALKAKYSSGDWLQVTQPLQDTLREKKRDALIAYLLANPGTQNWKDENDLYSYFLLDVEMCSCQPTSRIVQATNSVQLFVQRCFLSLEDSIVVDSKVDSTWLQWKWMKNFRVWQANVKVFLYPENWIEPELLPDEIKSPFLKDLENDLLQNEVTASNVEDAFHTYLEKLDGIARLEVKGMWYDESSRTLHVFARTFGGDPKTYYYRRFIDNKRWTPWLKIDLDITSDHIVPVVYNNKIYLFWAIISEQAEPVQTINVPTAGQSFVNLAPPEKTWQIQLAFSEYKNGKWTPKKISNPDSTGQLIEPQFVFVAKENFVFTPYDLPDYDYAHILNPDGTPADTQEAFNRKLALTIGQNGSIIINCYHYLPRLQQCIFLGGFEVDPVKGYPVIREVGYEINLFPPTGSTLENMLEVEVVPPPTGQVTTNVFIPNKAKGQAKNLKPFQMALTDRVNYMADVYRKITVQSNDSIFISIGDMMPYFYQDLHRTYYVVPESTNNGDFEFRYTDFSDAIMVFLEQGQDAYMAVLKDVIARSLPNTIFRYFNFHHPLVHFFMLRLITNGIDGVMDRDTQLKDDIVFDTNVNKSSFVDYFNPGNEFYSDSGRPVTYPNGVVDKFPGYPKDDVDFSIQSGYGFYNWELFFHAPLMIAERLSQNLQFDDADRWYRYIFNPVDTSAYPSPNKFWNTKPFFYNTNQDYINQRIENVLKGINGGQQDLVQDVADWRNNPFQPHFIAQYRTVAYQKTVVMKYIGHLLRHGDYLFTQHTMESVNEATQLYILAAEILGPKPEIIPSPAVAAVDSYYQLEQKLYALSDALVDVENLVPLNTIKGSKTVVSSPGLPSLQTLYFCIPPNENMTGPTGFWDTVADGLFKIRHCLDIDGTSAPLSLFSPAIDPGMLVRAAEGGLDIGSILNDINASLPLYRFAVMIQKATELCNEVKSLGAAMLSVLEKKDAEALSLLRSGQEIKLMGATLLLKQKQVLDAQASLDNLSKQKELITIRQKYYSGLISEGLTNGEIAALGLNAVSATMQAAIGLGYVLAGGLKFIPNFTVGVSGLGSPVATATSGGEAAAGATEYAVKTLSAVAGALDKGAAIINTTTSYQRRADEWQFQLDLANKELEQIDKQILGAQIRLDITMQDIDNQQLQIDQAREADNFMHSKFTNEELFSWMITQTSTTYFKTYQLAYDIAKQAEHCFRYELGLDDSAYINFGYWDNLKKGLLAGDMLFYDIKNMEMAYYEQNKRELELTKPISLSQLDPVALLKLKTTGECWINLPEELFDMDYPGHYMRRIKSVSLTIPCISGPYTTVSCKLTMTKNSVRTNATSLTDPSQYSRKLVNGAPADDPRFRDAVGALQSIATSHAQNDSGLFELNFRDERYLPFEGAGAISLWHLELPAAVRQFDYDTISDVIIHLKYTARDGGDVLKTNAATSLNTKINQMLVSTKDTGLMRIFSAKNDLATEWYRFLNPLNTTDDQVLTLSLDKTRFPLFVQGKTIKIKSVELAADSTTTSINGILVTPAPSAPSPINLTAKNIYGKMLSVAMTYNNDPGTWLIKNPVANARLTGDTLKNMVIIVHYRVS